MGNQSDHFGPRHQVQFDIETEKRSQATAKSDLHHLSDSCFKNLTPMARITVDEDGCILEANSKASRLLTGGTKSPVPQSIWQYVHGDDHHLYNYFHRRFFATGEPQLVILRMVKEDGTVFEVELKTIAPPMTEKLSQCHLLLRDLASPATLHEERELIAHLLTHINGSGDLRECVSLLTASLQEWSGCEAVGIRLREKGDYPYFETRGFPEEFVEKERYLCNYDKQGDPVCDTAGNPQLECMCGNVLQGRVDPRLPFFTQHGSFWTNSTTRLLAETSEADRQARTRNRCNGEGYESVALIPLRIEKLALGLIQLNDPRPDRFSSELIAHFERIADTVALALSRRQLLITLRENEEKYRTVADFTYAMEAWRKPDGTYGYVSPSCQRITGHSVEEFLSSPDLLVEISHPENRQEVIHHFQGVHREGVDQNHGLDFRIITPGGETRWLGHSCSPIYSDSGEWRGRRETYREITKRKEEEEKILHQSQYWKVLKTESLGRMAGAVAHHFNNKFHVLINCLEGALHDHANLESVEDYLETALETANQAAEVSRSMLTYLGQATGSKEKLDMADACRKALAVIKLTLPDNLGLEADLPMTGPAVMSSDDQIHQMLANLLSNACEAGGEGGSTVCIRLYTAKAGDISPKGRYPANWEAKEEDYACLEVQDSGCGLQSDEIEVIFDPFYTSKFTGRGMGLAVVLGLVQANSGVITVESSPGEGSVFRVFLPLVDEKVPEKIAEPVSLEKTGDWGTVLLVDDDETVLKMSEIMLSRLGFNVFVATSGEEAVELFRRRAEDISLVLSDFSMPGMNGMEALQILRGLEPNLPAILISGYSEEEVMEGCYAEKPDCFLKKPYDMNTLQNAVQYSLDKK